MKTVRLLSLAAVTALVVCNCLMPAYGQEAENPLRYVPGFQLQGGRIGVGNLRLLAGVGVVAERNDNIYYASGQLGDPNEFIRGDWIGHVMSSIFLDKTFEGRGGVRLGYQGDWAYYDKYSENDWKNNVGRFDLDYFAPGGLIARIRSSAARLEDPYGNVNQFALGVPKTKRWVYDAGMRVGYRFSDRFRFLLLGSGFKQDYDEERDFTQNWEE
jgi:hypothetical protein